MICNDLHFLIRKYKKSTPKKMSRAFRKGYAKFLCTLSR
jgi:hypothetical protein